MLIYALCNQFGQLFEIVSTQTHLAIAWFCFAFVQGCTNPG